MGAVMREATGTGLGIAESLFAGTASGPAREVVASVCKVLAEELSDDALELLHRALPGSLADLLVRPDAVELEDHPGLAHRRDTLAEGRPGSHHPVTEARSDRTQAGSVASDNPHADTKLSASEGTTQEREHETIADGHPESRPIATTRE